MFIHTSQLAFLESTRSCRNHLEMNSLITCRKFSSFSRVSRPFSQVPQLSWGTLYATYYNSLGWCFQVSKIIWPILEYTFSCISSILAAKINISLLDQLHTLLIILNYISYLFEMNLTQKNALNDFTKFSHMYSGHSCKWLKLFFMFIYHRPKPKL